MWYFKIYSKLDLKYILNTLLFQKMKFKFNLGEKFDLQCTMVLDSQNLKKMSRGQIVAAGYDVLKSEDPDHAICLNWKTSFNISKLFCSKTDQEERGDSVKIHQKHCIRERRRKIGTL